MEIFFLQDIKVLSFLLKTLYYVYMKLLTGADPEIFQRGGGGVEEENFERYTYQRMYS